MKVDDRPWQILTGEFPPQIGGIADYGRQIARGLAGAGAVVHLWAPPLDPGQQDESLPGITVHREIRGWSPSDLDQIGRALDGFEPPRRIYLQYAPNAFGRRGMNFGLARWLADRRRQGDSVRVMFHEVSYIVKPGDRMARHFLAFAQRRLAARLLRAAEAVDVAIPYWERMLHPLDPVKGRVYTWLPVMSNVPVIDNSQEVAALRARLAPPGVSALVGSFGTFATDVSALVADAMIPLLLDHPDRAGVLIGRGSEHAASAWIRSRPELMGRVFATGTCGLDEISRHLQSCDLLIQPYPGGVCSKRTTFMAGLAHGIATVTTSGVVTESIWTETQATAIVAEDDTDGLIARAESLLNDPASRAHLSETGRTLYNNRFAVRRTIDLLTESVCS